ncbi:MAG: HAMP domain-containing protein, partial [Chloroflexi bacterium]|nr:HAMP domain-containing protein [Chloroflexota bacterium]
MSLAGALLIAWLYVWRVLLRRLEALAGWMRRMAGGDLEAQVVVGGQDEVAEMAAALEVFRRHALEVQRLNLVEKLAGELQEKNDELET